MPKRSKLRPDQIVTLVSGLGGCVATDRITVDGQPVGFMEREVTDRESDSGWVFLAGDESQAYMDNPDNLAVYDVNTIANYDPAILPYLYAVPGQRFERVVDSELFLEPADSDPQPDPEALPGIDVVTGPVHLGDEWSLHLPTPFRRREEDGGLVLWRPSLTFWIEAPKAAASHVESQMAAVRANISKAAFDIGTSATASGLPTLIYRVNEDSAKQPPLYAFVFGEAAQLRFGIYFDRDTDEPAARTILASVARS